MNCQTCGTAHPEGRKFCTVCGAALAAACPNCGSPTEPGSKFCGECGHNLAAEQVAATAPQPAPATADPGRQRFVTVMFADIVGFTPFSEGRDSEDVRTMLTRYFDRSREVVERFGGVVDKYIGDAVMAVWGADTAHEDDAERGVRAALELIDDVRALGEELGVELEARAGLNSGNTSVGSGGNERGLVVGDMVNTASRLQGVAEPGTVVVGRSTADLAGAAVEFAPLGEHTVKGKELPVEAFRALRVIARRGGAGRTKGLVPPFVGREHEMRILKDMLHATGSQRRARLVSVVGEGGIGKSRLSHEFLIYIDGLSQDVYYHAGRSPAYGDGVTFWSLAEMVRQRCGIAETDDDHKTRTKLRTALAEYIADGHEREWIEPSLAGLLGIASVPDIDRAELFGAWRTFFERVAERGTTIMVFEDVHWADSGLLDFIEEMTRRSAAHPILILTLARPGLLERRPGWGSAQAHAIGVQLGPLTDDDVRHLVDGMVPGIPGGLRDQIVTTAAGVPLYAVEFVRMLVGDGTLVGDGEIWTASTDTALAIPDSLFGVVGARIDLLEPADRTVLEDAAILGHSFTVDGLAFLRGQPEAELRDAVERLVSASLIELNTDPRSPERGQYQFVQALIKEVAHGRLPKADRQRRHLAVAEYLESVDDAGLASAIASHYVAAHEATPPGAEADDLAGRAVASLRSAMDRAASLQSHEQAIALGRQAVRIATSAHEQAALQLKMAVSQHALSDPEAVDGALEAMRLFNEAGNQQSVYVAAATAGKIYTDTWRSTLAVELFESMLDEDFEPATPAEIRLLTEYARSLGPADKPDNQLSVADRALAAAERHDLMYEIVEGLDNKAIALGMEGRSYEARILMRAARDLAAEHGLYAPLRRATNNLAYLLGSDSVKEAVALGEEQLEQVMRNGDPVDILWSAGQVLGAYAFFGRWDRFDEVLAAARALDPPRLDEIRLEVAVNFRSMLQGDPEGGERSNRLLEEEYLSLQETEDVQTRSSLVVAAADFAFMNGRFEEAYEVAATARDGSSFMADVSVMQSAALALRDADKLRAIDAVIESRTFRGRRITWFRNINRGAMAAVAGDIEEAAATFEAVAAVVREHGAPREIAQTFPLLARLIGTDHPTGRALAREGYDTVMAAGFTTYLDLYADVLIPPEADEAADAAG